MEVDAVVVAVLDGTVEIVLPIFVAVSDQLAMAAALAKRLVLVFVLVDGPEPAPLPLFQDGGSEVIIGRMLEHELARQRGDGESLGLPSIIRG